MFLLLDNNGFVPGQSPVDILNFIAGNKSNETYAVVRHRNVSCCAVGAIGFYLFQRFHIWNHPFPLTFNRPLWYNSHLLVADKKLSQAQLKDYYEAAVDFMIEQGENPDKPLHFSHGLTAKVSFRQLSRVALC